MKTLNEFKKTRNESKNFDETTYSQSFVSEYLDENKSTNQQTKNNDSYLDDFEEYWSEDEEDIDNTRLTNKASEREIADTVNVYKCQLSENKKIGNHLKNQQNLEGLL